MSPLEKTFLKIKQATKQLSDKDLENAIKYDSTPAIIVQKQRQTGVFLALSPNGNLLKYERMGI